MALRHLPASPRQEARAWNLHLGIAGFRYADLNRVRRLAALDDAFLQALRDADPPLAEAFERYRSTGGAAIERRAEAELLLAVAPHVGTFAATGAL